MDRVYLSWTVENWITVTLMVALGGLAVGLLGKYVAMPKGLSSLFSGSGMSNAA